MQTKYLTILVCAIFALASFALVIGKRPMEEAGQKRENAADERLEASYALEAMKWYSNQRTYPAAHVPAAWKQKAMEHIARMNEPKAARTVQGFAWSSVGPTNIGGRTRAIAVDPSNTNIVYAGSVSGGVWKSTDAGSTWTPVTDQSSTMIISSIAIDPNNTNIVYAATGEGFFNLDAYQGAGILKTTNGGASWTVLNNFPLNSLTVYYEYYFINKVIVRRDSSSVLYAALIGGLFKSTNSGTTWTRILTGRFGTCTDVMQDPTSANTFYATFGIFGTDRDGVYKSTDGGSSWTKLTNGFSPNGYGRIALGIAPSNDQILYAALEDSATQGCHAMLKSTNGGALWTSVTIPTDHDANVPGTYLWQQGWYANVLTVNPTHPDTFYVGGVNLFKTTDAGSTWSEMSDGYSSTAPNIHVDQHAIVFAPGSSTTMYFGNDGGVWKSTDAGSTFSNLNSGYVTSQFYSGKIYPSQSYYFGGAQDNGTLMGKDTPTFSQVYGGDGGVTAVNPNTTSTLYTEYVYMNILKSTNSGSSFSTSMSGIPLESGNNRGTSDRCAFISPYVLDPSNPANLVAGTFMVYRTTNNALTWTAISNDLTGDGATNQGDPGAVISALAVAKSNLNTIYVGTSGSGSTLPRIWVSSGTINGLSTNWILKSNSTLILPNRYITRIVVAPDTNSHAFVCYSGYGATTPSTPGHIFETTTIGASWRDISGNLPDIPVNALVYDPNNLQHLVAATDLGVFESTNDGTAWVHSTSGMPNVPVTDLDLRRADHVILASTHGRGMFVSSTGLSVLVEPGSTVPSAYSLGQNYPNPFNPTTTIPFSLVHAGNVELRVYDLLGREVSTLVNSPMPAGEYRIPFNASNAASGVYFYRLRVTPEDGNAPAFDQAKRLIIVR